MANYKYGWKSDKWDERDFLYRITAPVEIQSVDLRDQFLIPEIFNQGSLGSCTGNAIAYALAFNVLNKNVQREVPCDIPFSRLFIYYNERAIEGTINEDAGAQIRDGFKAVAALGACSEKTWPYKINRFATKPSAQAYQEATNFKAILYSRLNNLSKQELVGCLLEGFPFVLGFKVYESFENEFTRSTGDAQMPSANEQLLGGHAVCCVGYKKETDRFIIANSWGKQWGKDGYFTIPAAYICNIRLAMDFWTVKLIS